MTRATEFALDGVIYMFDKCCNARDSKEYELIHSPKPKFYTEAMETVIKELLWYIPNIDSYQSMKNELINDKVYDDFAFQFLLEKMGMDVNSDVKWLEPKEEICEDEWNFFQSDLCLRCQKAIIVRNKSLSLTNDFLRVIRNCIAHGHFAIVDDYLIGFNVNHVKKKNTSERKAIVKIRPILLLKALKKLQSPSAKEELVGYAFNKVGYNVLSQSSNALGRFDILLDKDSKQYAIEIKDYRGKQYIHLRDIEDVIHQMNNINIDCEKVLMIDTSKITKDVRQYVEGIENFKIIDLSDVKKLLGSPSIDVLT